MISSMNLFDPKLNWWIKKLYAKKCIPKILQTIKFNLSSLEWLSNIYQEKIPLKLGMSFN